MVALIILGAIALVITLIMLVPVGADVGYESGELRLSAKVCGMLLEMNADEQSVHDVVAGIGINVHQKAFEGDIAKTASSLDLLTGRSVRRADVVRAFLEEYEVVDELAKQGSEALMNVYRQHSATLGQRVQVISATGSFTGTAKAVTDSGSLIVTDDDGQDREVLAADVSVRGLMGYA